MYQRVSKIFTSIIVMLMTRTTDTTKKGLFSETSGILSPSPTRYPSKSSCSSERSSGGPKLLETRLVV